MHLKFSPQIPSHRKTVSTYFAKPSNSRVTLAPVKRNRIVGKARRRPQPDPEEEPLVDVDFDASDDILDPNFAEAEVLDGTDGEMDEDAELLEEDVEDIEEGEEEEDGEEEYLEEYAEEEYNEGSLVDETTAQKSSLIVENLDYKSAVKARDSKTVMSEIVPLSEEEIKQMADDEASAKAASALALPENAQPTLNRQGYQAFKMDGVDFLVAETADGQLDLADTFYYDSGMDLYARPRVQGDIPAGPRLLQVLPWMERRSPDSLKGKPAVAKMKKVYMVGVASPEPNYRVNMEEVYCFEAGSRTLTQCEVVTVGTPVDPVLRIRADGVTIEDSGEAPSPSAVSLGRDREQNGDQLAHGALPEVSPEALQERIEELEAQAEQMDELDDMPDAPMSDMM
ncbi:hypothetical protein CEUSTIGMA_g6994.t1 [Chlamydomonas eustigma]|uniref:Uncharacterized protein n=1 Tax=Chlamydomonas eustigma TaxID=1157962 RepID=A0A250X901_9CHLO|nr:hypothetical protein CEUSTIGMA_g6994.t1 [Chlamydomonas eustigma]|eukprot:GAX79553.1 hypothetical protein CEUSTIGMA_g6994.t1 [Chlamydomonas eustigma]